PAAAATGDVPPAGEPLRHLAAHRAGRILRLDLRDVAAIVLEDTIAHAWTATGRVRLGRTLAELEPRLPCPPWLRVSRGALVNLDWVDHLAPLFHGRYLAALRDPPGLELAVSRRRARRLRELLGL
ncbi:MAG: LytTR family transcriptional regulator DNA-binding domain-containing protein, partial [Candidatus Krumholzibacteriota bacterium]|nr:LytTR family transcriptional regulator DNA-binding domain-containing protein [Candidatus Krumholzibacteriota bacterium]